MYVCMYVCMLTAYWRISNKPLYPTSAAELTWQAGWASVDQLVNKNGKHPTPRCRSRRLIYNSYPASVTSRQDGEMRIGALRADRRFNDGDDAEQPSSAIAMMTHPCWVADYGEKSFNTRSHVDKPAALYAYRHMHAYISLLWNDRQTTLKINISLYETFYYTT